MKLAKRLGALALTVVLAMSLTACSPKQVMSDMVYNVVKAMGFVAEDDSDAEATVDVYATQGGSITFPEDMPSSGNFNVEVSGDALYIQFNGIANRSTSYFVAASDTVTITSYATTESTGLLEYKAALWQLSDDQQTTSYVKGSTVYFTTGGDCYTQQVSGLTPGAKYKITVSYDSSRYYITGGMMVTGVGSSELTDIEGKE